MLFFAAVTTAMGEPKRILVLHSVGRDFSPWAELARSFRAEVDQKSLEPIDFYEASLSSERLSANKDEGALSNYLQALLPNAGSTCREHRRSGGNISPEQSADALPSIPMLLPVWNSEGYRSAS
jgi:hypothetical protein